MKVETAEMQFIEDDEGRRWICVPQDDNDIAVHRFGSIEELHAYMIEDGYLTPNPLEKALAELRKLNSMAFLAEHDENQIKDIIRTLYEDTTE